MFICSGTNEKIILVPNLDIDVVKNPARNTPGILIIHRNPLSPVFSLAESGSRGEKSKTIASTGKWD